MSDLKKNPDYSKSAVNLNNNEQVQLVAKGLFNARARLNELGAKVQAYIPDEVAREISTLTAGIVDDEIKLKGMIKDLGSYQDVGKGEYALLQRKETLHYEPVLARQQLPLLYANLVIKKIETVDEKELAGLVKGGFINEWQMKACGTPEMKYAYVIKKEEAK